MQSFDIALFKGTDAVSRAITELEKLVVGTGDFSHVGILMKASDFPKDHPMHSEDDSVVYVFESTMSGKLSDGVLAADDHKSHLGVQLRDFNEVLKMYNGGISWASLLPVYREILRDKGVSRLVFDMYAKYNAVSYDGFAVDLAAAVFPMVRRVRDSSCMHRARDLCCGCLARSPQERAPLFCSELAACIYKDIGLLSATVRADNVVPVDFLTRPDGSSTWDSDNAVPVLFSKPTKLK